MCDTIGILDKKRKKAYFGKNSDRSPNERQVIEYLPAKRHREKEVKVTYLTIPEVEKTNALIMSRPSWMWGCEMGVNEFGVCIGNEALFTKGKYVKKGLTGMDLVRLGLERGKNALEALTIITSLLEEYGQGGNCGYDHSFYYDNGFLIMDGEEIYVLETHGKRWRYQKVLEKTISNCFSITNPDAVSQKVPWKEKQEDILYRHFSGSLTRQKRTSQLLGKEQVELEDLMEMLRSHDTDSVFQKGSVKSVCMHAGSIVGDHTTSSMVVELGEEISVYVTACSLPCLSIYKKVEWKKIETASYWLKREKQNRSFLEHQVPDAFYKEKKALETRFFHSHLSFQEMVKEEEKFYEKWLSKLSRKRGTLYFHHYWNKKNKKLEG